MSLLEELSYTPREFSIVKLAHESVIKCGGLGEDNSEMLNDTKLTLK